MVESTSKEANDSDYENWKRILLKSMENAWEKEDEIWDKIAKKSK